MPNKRISYQGVSIFRDALFCYPEMSFTMKPILRPSIENTDRNLYSCDYDVFYQQIDDSDINGKTADV